jgi:hypothetical protein
MIYRFYVGLDNVISNSTHDDVESATDASALDLFGGYTKFTGIGGWRDEDGNNYVEDCLVYEIATDDEALVNQFAQFLKVKFEQQSVLVVALTSTSQFV